ncbi:glycosyltransferase involved in cell wall biosynthesis [Actinomadura coerulea]|uniref:Glycosyltransferase involved in cell wall biosynthesis n=1 Tax=Actinomadura coerulea TaxID=46159 RepID=A0A7X0L0J9_9ACTN|nr:glycosyltransferase family 4 protein [Actinomadura coerulea]MBB6397651.1 glycosyltransferase involved in cell wall biosynthesis [Actinomadura coerulea]GGQ04109.1 glycosyltransferase WbpH [Actinomadura coerulea]
MRVCVCTVVHHPEDARILHRQIRALLDAGHEVTYIAPFRACNATPWRQISPVDVPRATGRRRIRALRAAHRALAEHAPYADVVLLHDPELLVSLPRELRDRTVVWDVHEDTAAALSAKGWVPGPARPLLRPAVRRLERRSERRHRLLLAEEGYRSRFREDHPVVPNTTYVSDLPPGPPDGRRAVYVGQLSRARGALDMIEMARTLAAEGVLVELIGAADADVREALRAAQREGIVRWYGFVPNDRALRIAEGAMAGLALLHDEPNYRHSMPTKVVEYMARGIPVISTPNPPAVDIVEPAECGLVVPFGAPEAAAKAVLRLRDDPALRAEFGRRGYEAARERFHWPVHAERFVAQLEAWAGRSPMSVPEPEAEPVPEF